MRLRQNHIGGIFEIFAVYIPIGAIGQTIFDLTFLYPLE